MEASPKKTKLTAPISKKISTTTTPTSPKQKSPRSSQWSWNGRDLVPLLAPVPFEDGPTVPVSPSISSDETTNTIKDLVERTQLCIEVLGPSNAVDEFQELLTLRKDNNNNESLKLSRKEFEKFDFSAWCEEVSWLVKASAESVEPLRDINFSCYENGPTEGKKANPNPEAITLTQIIMRLTRLFDQFLFGSLQNFQKKYKEVSAFLGPDNPTGNMGILSISAKRSYLLEILPQLKEHTALLLEISELHKHVNPPELQSLVDIENRIKNIETKGRQIAEESAALHNRLRDFAYNYTTFLNVASSAVKSANELAVKQEDQKGVRRSALGIKLESTSPVLETN
eukprot:GHVP01057061.1.p1 GENE.GHVP01057061.1~~GHVP01057061.1.p1  ORF type:complete len:341 (+),score=75.27 GHVP01057061.1:70-1092(+)